MGRGRGGGWLLGTGHWCQGVGGAAGGRLQLQGLQGLPVLPVLLPQSLQVAAAAAVAAVAAVAVGSPCPLCPPPSLMPLRSCRPCSGCPRRWLPLLQQMPCKSCMQCRWMRSTAPWLAVAVAVAAACQHWWSRRGRRGPLQQRCRLQLQLQLQRLCLPLRCHPALCWLPVLPWLRAQ
jgi:hypothetical protein